MEVLNVEITSSWWDTSLIFLGRLDFIWKDDQTYYFSTQGKASSTFGTSASISIVAILIVLLLKNTELYIQKLAIFFQDIYE